MERYDEALADVDRAIELKPIPSSAVARCAGRSTGETGGGATKHWPTSTTAIDLDPGYAWAMGSRGQTYRGNWVDYDEALADLNHAMRPGPRLRPGPSPAAGRTYQLMERYDEALANLHHAIGLDPSLADTFGALPGRPARRRRKPPADGTGPGTSRPAGAAGPPAESTSPPAEPAHPTRLRLTPAGRAAPGPGGAVCAATGQDREDGRMLDGQLFGGRAHARGPAAHALARLAGLGAQLRCRDPAERAV